MTKASCASTTGCRSAASGPTHFTPRRKLLYLTRLIPLAERNYNLVELGPRGTGKSFVYQQISPYCHLVSGGQTTVAQLFVNRATGQRGLVALWGTVAFDEAAGIRFPDKDGINIMKSYMEDGTFSRGRESITAEGSIVFVGNLDGDVRQIARTSNLFYPLPKEMDTAFYDRIHAYLPGWEFDKTRDEYYTTHFGFVSDYLAEVLRTLRKTSYVDLAERYYDFDTHLGGRDAKAVRKTVSGLVKLIHPDAAAWGCPAPAGAWPAHRGWCAPRYSRRRSPARPPPRSHPATPPPGRGGGRPRGGSRRAPAPHPVGDQRPLILGDGAADLQEEAVVWVLPHRAVVAGTTTSRPSRR